MGEAANKGRSIELFEFIKLGAVDNPGDDFTDVVRLAGIGRNDPVQLFRGVEAALPGALTASRAV